MTINLPYTFEPPTEERLKEAYDAIRYETSVTFHSERAKESMKILLSEALAARKFREEKAHQGDTLIVDLYERWVKAGPPPLGTSLSRWWDARLVELHEVCEAVVIQEGDTLGEWLQWRFGARDIDWAKLPDEDKDYWEHHAKAVRRAVARGGFKNPEVRP